MTEKTLEPDLILSEKEWLRGGCQMGAQFVPTFSINEVKQQLASGRTHLDLAAHSKNRPAVIRLLDMGHDVNAPSAHGVTALHAACASSDLSMAELLIDSGADVNRFNDVQRTPLHKCVSTKMDPLTNPDEWQRVRLCQLLIEKGADLELEDRFGKTALHLAVIIDNPDLVKFLLSAGADASKKSNGNSAEILAMLYGLSNLAAHIQAFENAKQAAQEVDRVMAKAMGDIHLLCDVEAVAQWLKVPVESIEFDTKNESIDPFVKQIHEMESSYTDFPREERRTSAIERLLRAGEPPRPVYVERDDEGHFIMEGRHRIVAFHRIGLKEIPVCRVRPMPSHKSRIKP